MLVTSCWREDAKRQRPVLGRKVSGEDVDKARPQGEGVDSPWHDGKDGPWIDGEGVDVVNLTIPGLMLRALTIPGLMVSTFPIPD